MQSTTIIIVNWNTGDLLKKCIESLLQLPEQDLLKHVVIVDNASSDDSFSRAREAAHDNEKYSFVRSGENLGFARANNIGIKRLPKDDASHILLLNPDTEMKPGSLKALLAVLENNEKTGIVGPKLLNPDGTHQPSVRNFPTALSQAIVFLKLHRLFPGLKAWRTYVAAKFDYTKEGIVEQVMGACFLIRRETLQKVGMLDQRFWVWFEEVDFCKRAVTEGWNVMYTPSAEVIHHGGVSFGQLIGLKRALPFIASSLIYASKHFSAGGLFLLYCLSPVALLLAIPASLVHSVSKTA